MNDRRTRILRSVLRLSVFVVVTVVLWWFLAQTITPFADVLVASAFSLGLTMLIVTAGMMRIYELRPFGDVGFFINRAGAAHLGMGAVLGAGTSLLVVAAQWACGWARFERVAYMSHGGMTISLWFLVLLVGATGEELLFRGYGFQHLILALGPWLSIGGTSLLFAWGHAANPAFSRVGLVNTALFGIVFGYAYWRTLDLWLPLGMHFAWNFALATVGANVSGLKIKLMGISVVPAGSLLWSGGDYGPEASLVTTLVLVATGVFLWKAPLVRQRQGILAEPAAEPGAGEGPAGIVR